MAEFPEEEESVASISPDEDNTDAGTEPSPISNDDFATMPEPPQRPMVEAAPVPPKKPKLSGNPERFQDDIDRVNEWVERSRRWEAEQEAKAQKAEFEKSRKAHNAEARKISAATGAQFNYDADGVAQARVNPQTGEQAFTKRTSPVRYDDQGRPFQVIQNEQGTQSERIADPDANADIGPNPDYPEDKFIYRKTKFQPWQPIDPEEGINSTDGRVVRASAKALFDREKTTLKRERDEISLNLRDPARQNRLSPEARQKAESELSGLSQAAPPPAQVKGMFGGVNIEATEAAKKKWQEAESFRAGLLAEKQSLLAADDERAGLEARQYELDQNLLGLEKKPLSTFLQERRKKKSESLADLDPQTAKAEIEARGAAIAEDDASTESAMQDLQRRSDALNNRTKKGITIQEMDGVAAERAGIEADARTLEERVARRNAAAGEMMQGVEAIKAKETAKREESFAELDRQAAKYPELADDAKAFRSADSDYRTRMESLQQQPDGEGKQAAIEALNSEFETKRKETGSAYVSKLEKRISGDVGAAIEKVAGPGGALGFKSQIAALEKDTEIDPDIKKIATEVIRNQAVDALIRSNNLAAVKPAVNRPEGQSFNDAYKAAGYLNPENPEDRAKAAQMLEQDPGLGAKLFDGFDRAMTTFGARIFGAVSVVGKAVSYRLGLDPDNAFSQASEAGYQVKLDTEKIRENFRDPRLETDDAVNRWIMPAVAEALPNLAGMALTAVPIVGPALSITYNIGQLYDEAYSQASQDASLTEDQKHNASSIYAALALPAELIGDIASGGIFTSRMIPKAAKRQSVEAASKFWSKFTNVAEVWDKLPPVLKRSVAIVAAGGTEGLTETAQDKILNASIDFIKNGNLGDSVTKALADNRGALDTFIIASMSGGGIKTLETATRTLIERGQNPEEMARRYNGVANSFRLENVLAYAQQAGTKFDSKEYEKLTEASNGLLMRLDRINPNDKVARNDVSRELAQVESRRLTIISEILGKGAVDQAMAGQGQQTPGATRPAPILPENIAAMRAEIGKAAPERQAPLATAIKILSGASMDSLTKAEQDAIKPHTAKVGGQTVLTDDILTELSQTSPQAATLMQQGSIRDEATRRLEILSTEKEGGENNNENQIQQKGPENAGQGIQGSENAGQNDQGIGTGTLTPAGAVGLPALPPLPVGRGGELVSRKEKKVADTLAARLVQSGADINTSKRFAEYFIKRETLKGWGTEKLNAAVNEFRNAGGMQNPQAILASIEASDATQGAEIDNFTNEVLKGLDSDPNAASMQPQDRANIKRIIRNQVAPSILRFRPIFRGIVSYFDKSDDSDLQVNRTEKLLINSAAILAQRRTSFYADTENVDRVIDEEIGHVAQMKVLAEIRRERTGETGEEDLDLAIRESEEIFLQLPQQLQEASRKIYGDENAKPGQSGMEFFRQMLQGDIAISEGRVLDRNGKILSELAVNDRPWIEKMKSMFERLFKVFTDLRGNLGTMLRDEGRSDAEIEELTSRVERIRKDSLSFFQNLKKEGDRIRGEAYGKEYARKTNQLTGTQQGGTAGSGTDLSGSGSPSRPDGRATATPSGTDGQLSPAGNALGQDQAARLAELESKEQERQSREERAKERRAEYVAAKAGNLKDYDKVVESTPEDAREPVKQLLTQAPSGNTGYVLAVNQRRLPSTWIALPPGVVQTSHIGPNFQKNPEYAGQNTRAYDSDPAEQNKVRAGALPGALNEDILTSTDPSSANSAPQVAIVIDAGPDGQPRARWQAAGGNAREMMSNLAPQEDQDRLSQTWNEKGQQFGFEAMPEGFRGYRFLGTFDIRTEAGAREYQKLVDDLNPSTGVVQDVSDRADLDAKNIPLDLVADLPVMMSGKQATEALSRLLTAPGNIVERNRIEPMVKNPAQAQAYMQRVMFTAGLGQPTLTNKIADYQLQNRNAAFVELSADAAKSAIALRQSGSPGIADAFGGLLSNVADYLDQDRSLKSALELASSQIEMDALVGDTGVAVGITQRLAELIVLDKRGRINTDATSEAMKDYMVALSSGIARATEDEAMGNLFGQPMTMAERVAAINAAHRRNAQPASETTLSTPKNTEAKRMRELEQKRRQEGLTMREAKELTDLETAAGQQFMDFFQEAQAMRFELEQEVERRGIERAPLEQMNLVLSAPRTQARAEAVESLQKFQPQFREYKPSGYLSDQQKKIEKDFVEAITAEYEQAEKAYAELSGTEGGRILDMDEARELSGIYAQSKQSRTVHASSVQQGVREFIANYLLKKKLASDPPTETSFIGLTSGGPGSGKSRIKNIDPDGWNNAEFIYDGTLQNLDDAVDIIEQAKASKRTVKIWHIYIPIETALKQALNRTNKSGRALPISVFFDAHFNSQHVARRLLERYAGDIDVQIVVINNSGIGESIPKNPLIFLESESIRYRDTNETKTRSLREFGANLQTIVPAARRAWMGQKLEEADFAGVNGSLPPVWRQRGPSGELLSQERDAQVDTLSAPRRQKTDSNQLGFDFSAPEVQTYKSTLEAEGITAPQAQAAAAMQDLGLPATEALDLFSYQPNAPAANSLTAPDRASNETPTNGQQTTIPEKPRATPLPEQPTSARGAQEYSQDGGMGDLFSLMARIRADERDSADIDNASRNGPERGRGVSEIDGRQGAETDGIQDDGDRRSDGDGNALPISGGLGGQRGRAVPAINPRLRRRILQPGHGTRVERPPVGSPERNISLTRDQALAPRGIVGKLRANLDAIRVIQSIDNEKRLANPQEKQQLVKFSGWGALSQVFDDEKAGIVERGEIDRLRRDADRYRGYIASNAYYAGIVKDLEDEAQSLENWKSKWYDAHKEVRALLSDQEYRDARRSTINAHYTSPEIVGGMWDIIKWMGFKGGNILEPGAGIGHFFGLMPEEIADRSKLFGVELDAYTSKILKALYPEADIQNTGFQTADIADNSIDLAISNVPFANIPVRDPALEAMGGPTGNLHDYFFGKTITKLKPGGIQVFITSAFTMDKGNPEIRKWLAERADLIAAYRLPNDAFRENAGTDVVTDIIILRKKDGKPFPHAQSWVNLDNAKTRKGEDIRINEYFATHPQNILGQLDNDGSMYGDEKEMTVHGDPSRPPAISMQQDLARLPQGILGEIEATGPVRTGATSVVKVGNIIERDGKFYRQGQEEPDAELNEPKTAKRTRSFLSVRDALNSQYDLELSETATDEEIEANRRVLNTAYTRFLAENGYFHDTKNKKLFIDDPDYFRILGAEIEPKANQGTEGISAEEFAKRVNRPQKKTYTRADIFNRRVMAPRSEPTSAETIEDAYGISLGWRGRVDTQFIGQLVGKTPEQVETQLLTQEIAVRDPDTGNIVSREQYLAGNVRKKLSIARAAGADYARNVRLLEPVQPQRVGIDDIRFSIGATWIPADIYNRFLQSLGVNSAKFVYVPTRERSGWERDKNQEGRYGLKTGVEYKQYETIMIDVESIMDSLLNLRAITIRLPEKEGGGINMGATTAARERAKLLNQSFQNWVRSTPDVTAELEEQFNNEVNAFVQRTYDGQFLQFPWANKDFDIYPDKKNTIWRALQEGFGLIAHGVGGGKTIIGSAVALEMRRLGMARKPMIVVHNATLEGFAQEISKMAPTARVLVGRKDELQGDKRKEFLMRIAAGDWDAVVIAHSTFGMIEDDPQVEINTSNAILDEFVATLRDKGYKSINAAKEDRKKPPSVKALIKQMERLETSIKQASERRKDTGLLNFQQLGVDALIVDEVHKFKKMPFSTQLEAKGIDGATSKRAYNLLMRARYIQERMGGKNVFSMTGTPVTNTLGEIWNMARLVAPNVLKEWNIELFDQFVSKFAQVTTEAEMGPTGEFKNVDRLAKFVNLPEWNTFLRQAADVKLGDDLVVKNRPGIKGGKPELVAVARTKGVSSWVAYIRQVLEDFADLSGEKLAENPSLTAVPVQAFMASRAAAIDIRLINPRAKDEPDSKVNRMVERLMGLYRQSANYSGTQVIFADSFNNVRTTLFEGVTRATLDLDIDPTKPAGTTFNLYEDIRQKLIAQGIPTGEIAVITDSAWNSDKKKQALFDLVNEGKIRVIIGSTERLGTGVNMQRLMLAAHHLDVPWTPAELEQRDGRVFRQGNVHGEHGKDIELIRYGMSDTLDAALWQKLETKQRFSNAALSGKVTGRELAEDKATMNLEEQRAVLSGKYGRRLWEITSRLQELDLSRRANEREAEIRSYEIRISKRSLEAVQAINERSQPSITKMRALSESIAANGTAISVSGQTFPTKVETIEAIKNAMETARRSLKLTFEGQQTADPVTSITVNDIPIHLRPVVRVDQQWNDDAQRMEQRGTVSFELLAFPVDAENDISFGAVTSPATLLSRLEELGDTTTGIESSKQNNVARLRELANMDEAAAWPYQAEYDALTAERVEVEKLYNADLKGKTDAVSNDTTLSAARRQVYDPNQLELDFDAAPRDQAAAKEDAEKSAAARFQSGLDGIMAMASTYSNIPGVDMDEVRQTARIALADAARTFNPQRGVPFGPYSSIVVRNRLNALYRRENLRRKRIPQSLDEPLPGDFDETRQDYTPDTKTPDAPAMASRNEAKLLIDGLMATLPERMRVAVEGYLQQRQQEEIGAAFGISKQAVSKLQQEGFKRLRQKLNERGIGSMTEILSAARKNPMTGTLAESIGEYGISGTLPLDAQDGMGEFGAQLGTQPAQDTAPVRPLDGQTRFGIPAENAFSEISYAPARVWGLRRLADRFEAERNSVGGQAIQSPIYRSDYDAHQSAFAKAAQAAERLYRDTLTVVDNANSSRRGTADYLLPRLPEVRALFTDTNGQVQFIGGRPIELESGEPLFAASGTPQDDGDFIAPGESFESDLKNLLNDLNGVPADLDNAVAKQEQAALEEGGGQRYQVGRPDLAFGANNPDVRGLDQFYTDRFLPETEAQWETAARDMVTKDFEGTRRSIEQAGLSGQTISPELTKAADQIANTLRQKMLQTGKDADRKAFNVFWYSYRATGTEAGRALAARRDPFKTPAMRHREFLLDLMLTPGKKDKQKIDAEKDPAKKTAIIDSVTAALLKKLKDAGISPEDILGNRVVVGLNNAEIQRQFRSGLTPKQAEVFDLLLRKNQTPAQIAQRTGMKPDAVEAVFTAFKNRMRQQHLAKFKAGIHKQSEVTLKAAPTQTGLFGGQVSDAEADAAFDQWFSGMVGTSDTKKIGRPKFRIDDPAHVMRLARAIQSARSEAGLGNMAYEWWIMNILSGPQTQVTNIAGNAGFLALDSTLQRGMEALVNVFVRDKKAAQLGEFKSLARGIMPGITKGLAMAAKAWSAEHDFYEHTVLGTPLELGQWDKLGNTRAAIPGQTGRVVRIPGRALLFADSFFKQLSGQMNVAAFAYRIAKAEGLRGQALTDRVAQLSKTRGEIVSENLSSAAPSQEMVEYFARQLARRDASLDPAALIANRSSEAWELAREQAAYDTAKNAGWTEDAWIRAVEKSKEMTFQQDLKRSNEGGSLFEDAAAKLQDARFNNQLIGFFFPFVKTPYNIFRTGIRKSPIGAANLAWQAGKGFLAMKDGKAFLDGDPTLVRDLSEQLIAWTAMALIFGAVQGDDDDDDKMLLITGSQPRSEATAGLRDLNTRATGGEYMIRIGGRNGITIPYGRFDPIATVLGTTTDLIRSIKRNGSTTENLASLWNYMVAQTNSKTFLQGIANISTILEGKSDPVGATKRTVLQALVPNIIRQPLRNLDDYVRDTKTAPATYTLLPTGNLAEPKVDVYGNEIRKGSSPVMRLFFNSALATEPVLEATDNLLMNWNRSNPSMAYAPEQAKAVYKDRNGKEVEMTAEETRRFRLASGRLASVKLRAIATPARVANPTEDDIEAVRKAFSEARRETRERMFAGR